MKGLPTYEAGTVLKLRILQSKAGIARESEQVSVYVNRVISQTMSPVMDVCLGSHNVILKVYDRRTGSQNRCCYNTYIPYTHEERVAYHSFINGGSMRPSLDELDKEAADVDGTPRTASELREEPDGIMKFEAALWRKANKQFKTEIKVYDRLQDLQGVSIPEVYAVVRLESNANDIPLEEDYLGIYGILLQPISVCTLWDLPKAAISPIAETTWTSIVQHAVDTIHEINRRGIILEDSAPRNVVIQTSTYQPFIIDFAQCFFRETMFPAVEGDEWDGDAEFCEVAREFDNTGEVGRTMDLRVRKKLGFGLNIVYHDTSDLFRWRIADFGGISRA